MPDWICLLSMYAVLVFHHQYAHQSLIAHYTMLLAKWLEIYWIEKKNNWTNVISFNWIFDFLSISEDKIIKKIIEIIWYLTDVLGVSLTLIKHWWSNFQVFALHYFNDCIELQARVEKTSMYYSAIIKSSYFLIK